MLKTLNEPFRLLLATACDEIEKAKNRGLSKCAISVPSCVSTYAFSSQEIEELCHLLQESLSEIKELAVEFDIHSSKLDDDDSKYFWVRWKCKHHPSSSAATQAPQKGRWNMHHLKARQDACAKNDFEAWKEMYFEGLEPIYDEFVVYKNSPACQDMLMLHYTGVCKFQALVSASSQKKEN